MPQQRMSCALVSERSSYMSCLRRFRTEVWRASRAAIDAAIHEATGMATRSMLHDFSDESGDEMLVLLLERPSDALPGRR